MIIRTHFPRFLDYIRSSCALYQYQREIDKDGVYIANEQDYEIAREMMTATTSNQLMIPLTKIQRQILDAFAKLQSGILEIKEYSFEELFEHMQNIAGERWLRKNLDKLVEYGFLSKKDKRIDGINKPVNHYALKEVLKLELPSFKELNFNTNNTHNTINSNNSNNANKEEELSPSNLHYLNNLHSELRNQNNRRKEKKPIWIINSQTRNLCNYLKRQSGNKASVQDLIDFGFDDYIIQDAMEKGLIFENPAGVLNLNEN